MLGDSSVPGRTGHCGSPDAWAGTAGGIAGWAGGTG